MKLHELHPKPGAHQPPRRLGRGHGSGRRKTAGRGTKGQKSRTGGGIPAWFEGGQTPLHVRTPKLHGFKNRFRVEYAPVNLAKLSGAAKGTLITPDGLPVDEMPEAEADDAASTKPKRQRQQAAVEADEESSASEEASTGDAEEADAEPPTNENGAKPEGESES